jgi:hypothetical protein
MTDDDALRARYVFAVTARLEPSADRLTVEPSRVDLTVHREAPPPGESGWLFFRDNCWRGELNAPDNVGGLLADDLGLPVESVAFRELRATPAYHEALRATIAEDLPAFNADDVDEVLRKYLGSSVHVVDAGDL